jgi:hypothetical protein
MILLEYIIGQHQDGNVSVAVNSKKSRQENPGFLVRRIGGNVIWEFRGLHLGDIETIVGDERATRIDFYIGMDDLAEQRALFPATTGTSLGLPLGLRNPVGTERPGGKGIRWSGGIGRINIEDISAAFPPFKLSRNTESDLILNVDAETSPYPIVSDGGSRTIRELHFGIEHGYIIRHRANLAIPRIKLTLTEDQYATVLEYIDNAITFHI